MARLSQHLKYYVRKRISEDADWRNIRVILSGHDVSLHLLMEAWLTCCRSPERVNTRSKNSSD